MQRTLKLIWMANPSLETICASSLLVPANVDPEKEDLSKFFFLFFFLVLQLMQILKTKILNSV